jgi:ATP-binding cassette subfamily F protein uup
MMIGCINASRTKRLLKRRNKKNKPAAKPTAAPAKKKSKLTYQEQLDLEALPKKIEALEQKQAELHDVVSQPEFYQQAADKVTAVQDELATLEAKLEQTYERWEMLEEKQDA